MKALPENPETSPPATQQVVEARNLFNFLVDQFEQTNPSSTMNSKPSSQELNRNVKIERPMTTYGLNPSNLCLAEKCKETERLLERIRLAQANLPITVQEIW